LTLRNILESIGRMFARPGRSAARSSDARPRTDGDPDGLKDTGDDDENPFPEQVRVPFADILDLHSIPPRFLKEVVKDYLDEAHRRGLKGVRIIHGKGIGVQREMVRTILSRTSYVAAFRDAPAEAGGWGATVVTLAQKQIKDKARLSMRRKSNGKGFADD
jgi:hypothetical protein